MPHTPSHETNWFCDKRKNTWVRQACGAAIKFDAPEDNALLEEARRIYRSIRTIPLHIAAGLMEQGYIVEQLERQWDRENSQ